MSNAHAEQWKK